MREPKVTRLVAYVPVDLHQWVKERAGEENRTVSNLVETVLSDLKKTSTAL